MLGISAIIGSMVCIITMIPLQFFIGKRMSENAKITAVSLFTLQVKTFSIFFFFFFWERLEDEIDGVENIEPDYNGIFYFLALIPL